MIRHTLSFRFKDDVGEAARAAVLAELATFPERYPAMRNFSLGENISTRDSTFTHTMAVDFATIGELQEYLGSDSHESFVRGTWRPVIDRQAITSHEYSPREAIPMTSRQHGPEPAY